MSTLLSNLSAGAKNSHVRWPVLGAIVLAVVPIWFPQYKDQAHDTALVLLSYGVIAAANAPAGPPASDKVNPSDSMKTKFAILLASIALAFGLVLIESGCTTPSAQTVTYNTLATTGITVNSAYSAYLDLVVKGKVATNSVPSVSAAYNDFQSAYGAALVIAQFNPNSIAPSNVIASANSMILKINLTEGRAP